jgi:alpha-L-fucosidase
LKKRHPLPIALTFFGLILLHGTVNLAAAETETVPAIVTASPQTIAEWRKMKLGLFIHWGPVSVHGTQIGWSRKGERRGKKGGTGSVPLEIYDNLYKRFNPTKFDAEEWVQIAKDAGMKYMVFTTKHHDGFCNFDTQQTDYKITSPLSPYGRDIVKQLADACHQHDLVWGAYYSLTDWYHPDYRNGPDRHPKYIKYLHAQMRELLTNYGKVDIIWFDLGGWHAETWDSPRLLNMCRELQPGVIINNRIASPPGSTDYDVTEGFIRKDHARPWEACTTLCRQWSWKPNDDMKSYNYCIQKIARVVGADGNLMFNTGPMPDGRIEPRQVELLKQIGQWMKKYGESIYDTRGGPFKLGLWGASTYRDNTIYVHILDDDRGTVTLPPIKKKILAHKVLTGGTANVAQTDESIIITLDKDAQNDLNAIVVLTLDGPATQANPGEIDPDSVAMGKKVTASSIYKNNPGGFGPKNAVDNHPSTQWSPIGTKETQWLEVDLGKPIRIDRATIHGNYVRAFDLAVKDGDAWKTIFEGGEFKRKLDIEFPPVTAQVVRFNIYKAYKKPVINQFRLFEVRGK